MSATFDFKAIVWVMLNHTKLHCLPYVWLEPFVIAVQCGLHNTSLPKIIVPFLEVGGCKVAERLYAPNDSGERLDVYNANDKSDSLNLAFGYVVRLVFLLGVR